MQTNSRNQGTTLLHEISHLDSFGLQAGYPEESEFKEDGKGIYYTYHGTIDWKGIDDASNARKLKKSGEKDKKDKKDKDRPETWQNAESLAAAATEIFAMQLCDDEDIDV
jgi:hypothetical protein